MIEFLKIFLPYLCGVLCAFIVFRPEQEWAEGYHAAKKTYGNWEKGFNDAWEKARKMFSDYDTGFGDGFEAGWNSCEEQRGEQDD